MCYLIAALVILALVLWVAVAWHGNRQIDRIVQYLVGSNASYLELLDLGSAHPLALTRFVEAKLQHLHDGLTRGESSGEDVADIVEHISRTLSVLQIAREHHHEPGYLTFGISVDHVFHISRASMLGQIMRRLFDPLNPAPVNKARELFEEAFKRIQPTDPPIVHLKLHDGIIKLLVDRVTESRREALTLALEHAEQALSTLEGQDCPQLSAGFHARAAEIHQHRGPLGDTDAVAGFRHHLDAAICAFRQADKEERTASLLLDLAESLIEPPVTDLSEDSARRIQDLCLQVTALPQETVHPTIRSSAHGLLALSQSVLARHEDEAADDAGQEHLQRACEVLTADEYPVQWAFTNLRYLATLSESARNTDAMWALDIDCRTRLAQAACPSIEEKNEAQSSDAPRHRDCHTVIYRYVTTREPDAFDWVLANPILLDAPAERILREWIALVGNAYAARLLNGKLDLLLEVRNQGYSAFEQHIQRIVPVFPENTARISAIRDGSPEERLVASNELLEFGTSREELLVAISTQFSAITANGVMHGPAAARQIEQCDRLAAHAKHLFPLIYANACYVRHVVRESDEQTMSCERFYESELPRDGFSAVKDEGRDETVIRSGEEGFGLIIRTKEFDEIEELEAAVRHCPRSEAPNLWGRLHQRLGNAVAEQVETADLGDEGAFATANIERALKHYALAEKVLTRDESPSEWADIQLAKYRVTSKRESAPGTTQEAVAIHQAALEAYLSAQADIRTLETGVTLAENLCELARWQEAYDVLTKVIAVDERVNRWYQAHPATGLYGLAVYCLAQLGRKGDAVLTIEKGRARSIRLGLEDLAAHLSDLTSSAPEVHQRYLGIRAELAELTRQRHENDRLLMSARLERSLELQREIGEVEAKLTDTIADIRRVAGYESFLADVEFSEIEQLIDEQGGLVYFADCRFGIVVLPVSRHPQSTEVLVDMVCTYDPENSGRDPLLSKTFDSNEGGFSHGFTGFLAPLAHDRQRDDRPPSVADNLAAVLRQLGRIIEPVATILRKRGLRKLVLVAGGRMGALPLHAVCFEVDGQRRYLLDDFEISYAPNARAVTTCRLVLSNQPTVPLSVGGMADTDPGKPLPYARWECSRIEQLAGGDRNGILVGIDATRARLHESLTNRSIGHLACHGSYYRRKPLESTMRLSGGEGIRLAEILGDEGGIWSHLRLVVLSACDSGAADIETTPDETLGFPTGFLQAGVPGVVATLWRVDDLPTALVVQKFYELLTQGGRASTADIQPNRAIRLAQLWLRDVTAGELADLFAAERQRAKAEGSDTYRLASDAWREFAALEIDERPYENPYFWASFAMYGV